MRLLGDYQLSLDIVCAIAFPLLIVSNLAGWGGARNSYLWREQLGLMRIAMVVIAVLAVWSAAQVAVHFGYVTDAGLDVIMVVLGPVFLIGGAIEIWLGSRAFLRYRRNRVAG